MFSQTEVERDQYEARLKWIRDEEARKQDAVAVGRAEGLAEGLEKGILVGRIQTLQPLAGEPITPTVELQQLGTAQLTELAEDLERSVHARTSGTGVEGE